jgi:hypothetical protein
MELLWAICGVLFGGVLSYICFSVFASKGPKMKQMRENENFWYEETTLLRKEIKGLKRAVSNGKAGAVPYGALDATSDDQMIEAIFSVLPSNLKHIISPFKENAKDYIKANPGVKEAILNTIKQKAGAAVKQDEKIDSL